MPIERVRDPWKTNRWVVLGLGVALFLGATYYSWAEVLDGFWGADGPVAVSKEGVGRHPKWYDFADSTARERLKESRESLWTSAAVDPSPDNVRKLNVAHRVVLDDVRGNRGHRAFWDVASVRAKWAEALSFMGVYFLAAFLWLVSIQFLTGVSPGRGFWDLSLLIATILSPWIGLKAFSEWYTNFQFYDVASHQQMAIVLTLTFLLNVMIGIQRLGTGASGADALRAGISFAAGVVPSVAVFGKDWFDSVARWYAFMPIPQAVALNLAVVIALVAMLRHILTREHAGTWIRSRTSSYGPRGG